MNERQEAALRDLCQRYRVPFRAADYMPQFDLPAGYVAGWVGGDISTIYVGCDPGGVISS